MCDAAVLCRVPTTGQVAACPAVTASEAGPCVVVMGPTGSGKSHLALALAGSLGAEIVNFDSVQLYRGLDIGSAKLPVAERCGIPHHMIDIAEPADDLTAGEYARIARPILAGLLQKGTFPVLVGGTGFYLRALLDGLSPAPVRNNDLRQRLASAADRRPDFLHRMLRRVDAAAAERIHRNDHQKLIRAIELTLLAGSPVSAVHAEPRDRLTGYRVLKIGLQPERAALYERLDERTEALFAGGLLEETKYLLDSGVPPHAKALKSLGYRQAVAVLTAAMPLAEAVTETQVKTRQYAKRQMTWFRAEPDVHWLQGFGGQANIQREALQLAQDFLSRTHPRLARSLE